MGKNKGNRKNSWFSGCLNGGFLFSLLVSDAVWEGKKEGLYKRSMILPSGELEGRTLETMSSRGWAGSQATVHRTSHGQRHAPLRVMRLLLLWEREEEMLRLHWKWGQSGPFCQEPGVLQEVWDRKLWGQGSGYLYSSRDWCDQTESRAK